MAIDNNVLVYAVDQNFSASEWSAMSTTLVQLNNFVFAFNVVLEGSDDLLKLPVGS